MKNNILSEVLAAWGIDLRCDRPDLAIAGSPERTEFRVVIEDAHEKLFLLEAVAPAQAGHKQNIITALVHLKRFEVPYIQTYLPARSKAEMIMCQGKAWQLVPYIEGVELKRPAYTREGWRGKGLADFLIALRQRTGPIPGFNKEQPFSLINFIHEFQGKLGRHDPKLLAGVRPVIEQLAAGFFADYEKMPVAFCHGDYHPLNIIWAERGIKAVIDWEFLGYKAELYDIANMIGCLGMEDPACLTGDLVYEFIQSALSSGSWHKGSWKSLFDFVVALRLAWLSEWLRKPDPEMVELETVYIELLLEHRAKIEGSWELIPVSA